MLVPAVAWPASACRQERTARCFTASSDGAIFVVFKRPREEREEDLLGRWDGSNIIHSPVLRTRRCGARQALSSRSAHTSNASRPPTLKASAKFHDKPTMNVRIARPANPQPRATDSSARNSILVNFGPEIPSRRCVGGLASVRFTVVSARCAPARLSDAGFLARGWSVVPSHFHQPARRPQYLFARSPIRPGPKPPEQRVGFLDEGRLRASPRA
jgi:hypothetical protein